MNHEFMLNPNTPDIDKCIECGYPSIKHGDNAPCDCCDKTGNLQIFGKNNQMMLLTRDCMEREKALLEAQIASPEYQAKHREFMSIPNQEQRLENYKNITNPYDQLIGQARKIDEQLHLSSDIFTAKTVPIEDIRKAIWANPDIAPDKKFFEFVSECKRRITHLQTVIFDLDKKKIEAYSEQKAWHVTMNDYANKLRADEREALKISDITYDVKMPKPITPKAIKTKLPTKDSKKELRDMTAAFNKELKEAGIKMEVPEFMVQGLIVSKNWTVEQAIGHLRRTLKEGLSEQAK